jgi:tetratricopeptide (TPR) repeat protein
VRAGRSAIAASGAGESRRGGTRSLDRKTGKLAASESPDFRGSRFQVEFGRTDEPEIQTPADDRDDGSQINRSTIGYDREEKSGLIRWIIYILLGLVLLAAGFYGGLWASDRLGNSSSGAPVISTEMLRGREAFDSKNYQAAALEFDGVARQEPQNAEARYWLGRTQLEQGEYAKAAENFEQAIRIQPEFYDAYVQAAAAYEADGKTDRAERMLKQYVERRRAQRSAQSNSNRSTSN